MEECEKKDRELKPLALLHAGQKDEQRAARLRHAVLQVGAQRVHVLARLDVVKLLEQHENHQQRLLSFRLGSSR